MGAADHVTVPDVPDAAAAGAPGVDGDRSATLSQLRRLVERSAPVVAAHERTLPVLAPLAPLLPGGALRRGTAVGVSGAGATSLALALLAGPTAAGSWAACLGAEHLGWGAARELGVDLARTVAVTADGRSWPTVAAALVDAFDVLWCGPGHVPGAGEVRRLLARARERGAVVIVCCGAGRRDWPDLDVRCHVAAVPSGADPRCVGAGGAGGAGWSGPGAGWGRLRARRVTVGATGRGDLARARRVELWLPGPDGGVGTPEPVEGDVAARRGDRVDRDHPAVRHAAGALVPARPGPPRRLPRAAG